MRLFPFTPPRLGLSITTDSAFLVEIQRNWRGRVFRKLAQQPLPPKLIQLSTSKLNISEPQALSDALGKLSKDYRKPQPIALSLPDICGRTALIQFNNFPKKSADREALLTWRFQNDFNLNTKHSRVGYQVYEPSAARKNQGGQSQESTTVLATVVQNTIIEQYELACIKGRPVTSKSGTV